MFLFSDSIFRFVQINILYFCFFNASSFVVFVLFIFSPFVAFVLLNKLLFLLSNAEVSMCSLSSLSIICRTELKSGRNSGDWEERVVKNKQYQKKQLFALEIKIVNVFLRFEALYFLLIQKEITITSSVSRYKNKRGRKEEKKKRKKNFNLLPTHFNQFFPCSHSIQRWSHPICYQLIELFFSFHAFEVRVFIRTQFGENRPHWKTERVHITPLVVWTCENLWRYD